MIRAALPTAILFVSTACHPDLSDVEPSPAIEHDTTAQIELWPPLVDGLAAPVLRARIRLPSSHPPLVDAAAWVEGDVGDAHLRQLAERDPSRAFSERFVPTLAWLESNQADGTDLVLAPTQPLAPETLYTVAHGDPPLAVELIATEAYPMPRLHRVWPPYDTPTAVMTAVWCGLEPLPVAEVGGALDPGRAPGTFRTFATTDQQGAHCVRFDPDDPLAPPPSGGIMPPAVLQLGSVALQLDPTPLSGGDASTDSQAPLPCEPGEVSFGPGCARVQDDRLLARAPDRPLMWAISGAGLDQVFATAPLEPFTVRPLPPSSSVTLQLGTLDRAGAQTGHQFSTTTMAPMAHVVLNEVLANAKGPEPEQEWVELFNDGLAPAMLGELTLIDIGGETPLPHATLAPGAFALLVNSGYVADGEYDPAPAPGSLILEVPSLGKNGLANAGEPLKLVQAPDVVVSRFPDEPKPKAGISIARTRPDAPIGVEGSFVRADPPTPGAPYGPDAGR